MYTPTFRSLDFRIIQHLGHQTRKPNFEFSSVTNVHLTRLRAKSEKQRRRFGGQLTLHPSTEYCRETVRSLQKPHHFEELRLDPKEKRAQFSRRRNDPRIISNHARVPATHYAIFIITPPHTHNNQQPSPNNNTFASPPPPPHYFPPPPHIPNQRRLLMLLLVPSSFPLPPPLR
jgi:hypothetical protein